MNAVFRNNLARAFWKFRYAWLSAWSEVSRATPENVGVEVRMIPSGPYPISVQLVTVNHPDPLPVETGVREAGDIEEPVTYEAALWWGLINR